MTNIYCGISRRHLLKSLALGACGLPLGNWDFGMRALAAEQSAAKAIEPLNRFPRMVQEYFVSRMKEFESANRQAKAAIHTKADAERYVESVRLKIRSCFPLPEKTPLNPKITGVVERETYKIEKVIFESRPGFLVTANLYIPKGRPFPLPGIVGSCGHSENGKANEAYQSFSQGLVRMGYIVLIFDPISQGERLQYPDDKLKSRIGVGVREHLYAGNQQFLIGEFIGAWRAWDGIRALDYLLTREEVDPKHIGITGNSGGGTMSTWLCGLERRWTMAAPSCFVTTFRRNLENELPADTEQCPPKALSLGLDHEDFLAAMAPKPVIILAKEKDFFDIRGAEEAYARLKKLYEKLGAPDNITMFAGPTAHGYSKENREAMYQWFNRITGISNQQTEPELTIEKDETLRCAPNGQVSELKSRTVFSFTKETSQTLASKRAILSKDRLSEAVSKALKLPIDQSRSSPDYRILRVLHSRRYPLPYASNYAVETETGIHAIVYRLSREALEARPPRDQAQAVLYVSHQSSDVELREEPLIKELLNAVPNTTLFACDVRGIGESRPDTCGQNSFLNPYGSDYFYAIHSLMFDHPYLGQKTFDVLRVLDWLHSFGYDQIHLAGKGWGSLPATFAALISKHVAQVTLKNALSSFSDIAESEMYHWPLSAFLHGVLKEFDLPHCYRELADKKLRQIDPATV